MGASYRDGIGDTRPDRERPLPAEAVEPWQGFRPVAEAVDGEEKSRIDR